LTDEVERAIEAQVEQPAVTLPSMSLGSAKRIDSALTRYQDFCTSTFPKELTLEGLKIVFDGANGAGYKVGPRTLADLGAEVIPIGCSPNGRNINAGCGSTSPTLLSTTVPAVGANVGVALDGDGDRVVMIDEQGQVIDGDQLLYILAVSRQQNGLLRGPVVGTVEPGAAVEHLGGATIGAACDPREVRVMRKRNRTLMLWRNVLDTGALLRRHALPLPLHHIGRLLYGDVTSLAGLRGAWQVRDAVRAHRAAERAAALVDDAEFLALLDATRRRIESRLRRARREPGPGQPAHSQVSAAKVTSSFHIAS
jgi:hypothetical protein